MSDYDYDIIDLDVHKPDYTREYFDLVKYNLSNFVEIMASKQSENMFKTIYPINLIKILKQKTLVFVFNEYTRKHKIHKVVERFISKLKFKTRSSKLSNFDFLAYFQKFEKECVKYFCTNRWFINGPYKLRMCRVCGEKQNDPYLLNNLVICPGCDYLVDKYSGCNHITCVCGTEFCFECGKKDTVFCGYCGNYCSGCELIDTCKNCDRCHNCPHSDGCEFDESESEPESNPETDSETDPEPET